MKGLLVKNAFSIMTHLLLAADTKQLHYSTLSIGCVVLEDPLYKRSILLKQIIVGFGSFRISLSVSFTINA